MGLLCTVGHGTGRRVTAVTCFRLVMTHRGVLCDSSTKSERRKADAEYVTITTPRIMHEITEIDNSRCSRWRKLRQNNDIDFSKMYCISIVGSGELFPASSNVFAFGDVPHGGYEPVCMVSDHRRGVSARNAPQRSWISSRWWLSWGNSSWWWWPLLASRRPSQ